jgi:putative ABC transport system permease protein
MVLYNLKLILRRLKARKLYSILNISGFAIGFAVVVIIALFINNERVVDRNFKGYKSISRLIATEENDCWIRFEVAQHITEQYPEVEYSVPVQYLSEFSFSVGCDGEFATLRNAISTNNMFFRMFDLKLIEGFTGEPFSEKNSAVISKRLATLLFDDNSPLGKTIDVGGFIKARITGVVDDFPSNTSFISDLYLNIEDENLRILQSGNNGVLWHPAYIFIRLKEGFQNKSLDEKLARSEILLNYKEGNTRLQPLKDIYFDKQIKNNTNRIVNTTMIYLFAGIAFLILFLSVANHINFSIALQLSRLKETGIRKSFGAGIRQLIFFYLYENLATLLLALVIAIFLAIEVIPAAGRLLDRDLNPTDIAKYPVNILIAAIIALITVLTSIVPVYLVRKFDINRFMKGNLAKAKGGTLYRVLSIFQTTISVILIICMITIYKQLSFAKHGDTGFDREQLIRLNLPGNFEKGAILKQEFSRLPFVRGATLSLGAPGAINSRVGSGEPDNQFWFDCIETDEDFIPTLDLKIVSGRNFRMDDRDTICIINEAALKQYGWQNIENKRFRNYGLNIVGVVNDFHVSSFHDRIEPAILVFKNRFRNTLSLRLSTGNISEQIISLNETWDHLMPEYKFDYVFYDDFFNSLYEKEEREASAITSFSVLALVITLMGMIGLIIQSCLARSKEIGIRKINGASVLSLIMILNRENLVKIGIAFLIAVPISWYAMGMWLQNFAYRTDLSWWIAVAAGLIVLIVSATTLSRLSWKTATRNPVEALRYE